MDEYVEVFAASDITLAYLMKANLENAGIPVQITNENLQGAYCLDGMVPGVLVPASHVEQAKQIIKEIQQSSEDGAAKECTSAHSDTADRKKVWAKKRRILCLIVPPVLAALILNAFFTWGIIFDCDGGFEWSGTYIFEDILTEKRSGRIRLGENPPNTLGIPLVFWICRLESICSSPSNL
ncbi:MAG: putative signal transducing protein [Planctomycetota bacterium]|jgi:hypothetical protein